MDNAPFHHSKRIRQLIENAGCELWYLPKYSRLFPSHRGGKKLRLKLEKSYLNTNFMFIKPPTRLFKTCKYFSARCYSSLGENEDAIRQLAEEALAQTTQITQRLNSVEQMDSSIQEVANKARQATEVVQTASMTAETGEATIDLTVESIMQSRETVAETAKKVKRLGESSQQISKKARQAADVARTASETAETGVEP